VVNLAHSAAEDQRRQAEQIALGVGSAVLATLAGVGAFATFKSAADLASINGLISGILGAASGVLSGLAGLLGFAPSDPNCNSEVLTRAFGFQPGELAKRASFTFGPTIPPETAKSPSEYGNDPHFTIIYGIRAALPARNVAAVSSTPRGTQIFALGEDRRVWTKFFDPQNLGPEDGDWSVWFPL
jgi:NAD-dependent oxidoreductase involved in siderophore biosynthesis